MPFQKSWSGVKKSLIGRRNTVEEGAAMTLQSSGRHWLATSECTLPLLVTDTSLSKKTMKTYDIVQIEYKQLKTKPTGKQSGRG